MHMYVRQLKKALKYLKILTPLFNRGLDDEMLKRDILQQLDADISFGIFLYIND